MAQQFADSLEHLDPFLRQPLQVADWKYCKYIIRQGWQEEGGNLARMASKSIFVGFAAFWASAALSGALHIRITEYSLLLVA
jgi:hypothetical protein